MSEPFIFTLVPASQATLTLTSASQATLTLRPAASHRNLAEWIADQAVLFFDSQYPNGF